MHMLPVLITGAVALTAGDLIAGKWIKNKSKILYAFILLEHGKGSKKKRNQKTFWQSVSK